MGDGKNGEKLLDSTEFPGVEVGVFWLGGKKNARPKSHLGERCSFLCWHFGAG